MNRMARRRETYHVVSIFLHRIHSTVRYLKKNRYLKKFQIIMLSSQKYKELGTKHKYDEYFSFSIFSDWFKLYAEIKLVGDTDTYQSR